MFRKIALAAVAGACILAAAPQPQPFHRPVVFEPNRGQAPEVVKWIARGSGYQLYMTAQGVTMMLPDPPATAAESPQVPTLFDQSHRAGGTAATAFSAVRMKLAGSPAWDTFTGLTPTGGISNYFVGNDPKKWRTDIPQYASLKAANVYAGIDLVLYTRGEDLEYDFVVAPGADPKSIRLAFDGVEHMDVAGSGDLRLHTAGGSEIRHIRPKIYQQYGDRQVEIAGAYEILERGQAGFTLASYDRRRPLIIDPNVTVTYTRFLSGGSADTATAIAVDGAGNAYVTGTTISPNFPIDGAYEPIEPGGADAFVTKLAPNGSIVFSTYFGGVGTDNGAGIAVDSTGVYITGDTLSSDFPGSRNLPVNGASDMFVTKFAPAGNTWLYSHAIGGWSYDAAKAIAVDSSHAAYITGYTYSSDFPKVGQWATFYNGNTDAFVMKVAPDGSIANTAYIGGSGFDEGLGIAVDAGGAPWITGETCSNDFPHTMPVSLIAGCNTFVVRVNKSFTGFVFATEFGGGQDFGTAIVADTLENCYVTGVTFAGFPVTPGAFQTSKPGLSGAAFVIKLDYYGGSNYATYFGGSDGSTAGQAIALDRSGTVYVAGETSSTTLPGAPAITPNPTAGFFSKFSPDLSTLNYTTFLGASITGIATYHNPRALFFTGPTIYTAGYRFTGGLDFTNRDAFVVQLSEPSVIVVK